MVVAADGVILSLNPSAELLLGASVRHAAGRRIGELGPGLGELEDLVSRAAEEQRPYGQNLEISPAHIDHQHLLVTCRVTPLNEPDNTLLVELLDTSQSRQLDREKALISQRGASRRIIRQLAHEIRNPLGGLRGAAQLLDRELDAPELKEYTQVIIREADRLVGLTDSLLGPTRQACKGPVNIHEVAERVLMLIEGEAPGVQRERDYDPSLPRIEADADQLTQALLNLARNAVQWCGEQGRIAVRTRALTGYIIDERRHKLVISLEIEDNGPGIPEELADSIFYPLVSGRDGGTGLGLPTAQDLVSRNGGFIEFESVPGRTVFMLRFPAERID